MERDEVEGIRRAAVSSGRRPRPAGRLAGLALRLGLLLFAVVFPVGCIQDEVVIPVALLKGKIVPVGISQSSTTTTTTTTTHGPITTTTISVVTTINTTVPTVGVRINTTHSGTLVSLINPIGPAPGSPESTFATVTGDWVLPTAQLGHRRVVARGVNYDLAWGDTFPNFYNLDFFSINLKSVTIPLNNPLRTTKDNDLLVKSPGRGVFVLFAEDFTIGNVPVRSCRLILDDFTNPAVGINMPDDGGGDPQPDHPPDSASQDLSAGDGVFTRVLTGLTTGPHQYGFVINNDGFIRRDPYEESSDDSSGVRRSVIQVF